MIRAKIMLAILKVVFVCAICFAFRAKTYQLHFIYTGPLNSGVCQTKVCGTILPGTAIVAASTVSLASGCPNVFTTVCEGL